MLTRFHEERGVAAVTVLLVTMVLAVAGAVVAFSATTELEVGARDVRSEEAFTASEGGFDVAAAHFFKQAVWDQEFLDQFPVGEEPHECLNNPLVADEVEVTDPDGAQCGIRITSPTGGSLVHPTVGRPFVLYTVVSEAQEGRTVTRTLATTYRLEALDIPFGLFVDGNVDLNGTPDLLCISMLVSGNVTSRNKLSTDCNNNNNDFDDVDLGWDFHKDRIRSSPAPDVCDVVEQIGCTGVYANGRIFAKDVNQNDSEIHGDPAGNSDPQLSAFPRDRDRHQQNSTGDQIVSLPGDEILEPMDQLKALAEEQGLYFNFRDGSNNEIIMNPADIGAPAKEFEEQVVVYFDADAGDTIGWKVDLIPGSTDSDILHMGVGPDSGILVVRGGGLRMESGLQWSGAAFVPEGTFRILGNVTFTGTIYAKGFASEGGTSTIQLTPDWFTRVPAGLFTTLRTSFQECEPFQTYAIDSPCAAA